jgi:hypothetical protein
MRALRRELAALKAQGPAASAPRVIEQYRGYGIGARQLRVADAEKHRAGLVSAWRNPSDKGGTRCSAKSGI